MLKRIGCITNVCIVASVDNEQSYLICDIVVFVIYMWKINVKTGVLRNCTVLKEQRGFFFSIIIAQLFFL